MIKQSKTVSDFFAGIGLAGLGLQKAGWEVDFAVDYSSEKKEMYAGHFGDQHFRLADISKLSTNEVPNSLLYHASFPCTDMSVAGSRAGINAGESSSFWSFVDILEMKGKAMPPFVMLENVEGLLSAGNGGDLKAVLAALNVLGYAVDVLLIDAARFVPQSRVRLFVLGQLNVEIDGADNLARQLANSSDARPEKIKEFVRRNPEIKWRLLKIPDLPRRTTTIKDVLDAESVWWDVDRTEYLYSQMFDRHKKIVEDNLNREKWTYGTVFRRTRMRDGRRQSTAELRSDGIAGCLRTPKGGSARQIIVRFGFGQFDARLLSGKECARLMGADDFRIESSLTQNQVLFGFGDAVCVPVLEWIGINYLNPLVDELTQVKPSVRLQTEPEYA